MTPLFSLAAQPRSLSISLSLAPALAPILALTAAAAMPMAATAQPVPLSQPQITAAPHHIPVPEDKPYVGTMILRVDASDPDRGIFKIRQTIPVAAHNGRVTLLYPQWLPGKHAPRGAIADVAGFKAMAGGKLLRWTRQPTDVYAFDIDLPLDAKAVDIEFMFLSPTRSAEGRVVATPAMMNLQWEQLSFYPAGYFTRQIPVQLDVTLPAGWTGAAAIDGLRVTGSRYTYAPTSYENLIDSPMFAGRHFRKWDLGQSVSLNVVADEEQYLNASPDHIARHAALVAETISLFGSKPFDRYEFLLALTEELGGIGLEHHRSSENSRPVDYFTRWDSNENLRGLLPHELIHSWNGKHRRPAKLWTPDYRTPMQDNLLWVYEGQTSFWDMVLAVRSGMQSKSMVLAEWATQAAGYAAQPGREWRSVEDTTLDPIIAARKPRSFASMTRTEDYYNEGSLMWLSADMLIRTQSKNKKSLDDFAKIFFAARDGDYGQSTYEFDDVVAALNAVHPYDWPSFLRDQMQKSALPAPLSAFALAGYQLAWRDTPNVHDRDRMQSARSADLTHSLGMVVDRNATVSSVLWNGPAFREDIINGTKILAVNGLAYSRERLENAVRKAADGKTPIRLTVERSGRYREVSIAYHQGLRWPHLEKIAPGPDWFDRLFAARRPI